MKHKHFNRLLSMLLVVATLFGILAVPASAGHARYAPAALELRPVERARIRAPPVAVDDRTTQLRVRLTGVP